MKKFSILFLFFLFPLFLPQQAVAAEPGPETVVERLNDALLQSMKNGDQLGFQGRYRLLEPVITESFALPFMARVSTGRYWREMNEEQRKTFLKRYRQWSVASYANRFDNYKGEKFDTMPPENSSGPIVNVPSTLTKANGEKVFFTYKMRKSGGQWRIADVQVEGVSQLALTRSQFVDILKKNGFDGLIALLDEKIESLSTGPEAT